MNKKLIVFSFLFFFFFKGLLLLKLFAFEVTMKAKSAFMVYSPIYEDSLTLVRNRFQSNLLEV